MDTTEFEKLLNNTVIPSSLERVEQEKRIQPLLSYITANTPSRLYKYRTCCDNHISAFDEDQIWASTADTMNDGYDARLFFKQDEVIKRYNQQTSFDNVKAYMDLLKESEELRNKFMQYPVIADVLPYLSLPPDILEQGIKESKVKVEQIITDMLGTINIISQRAFKFCCFSENVNSAYMWGQYSNNESGFCLQYDFSDGNTVYQSNTNDLINTSVYPVIYKKHRYQVPAEYIEYLIQYRLFHYVALRSGRFSDENGITSTLNSFLNCPDIMVGTKIALNKSEEWKFEHEWRLFCTAVNGSSSAGDKHVCITKKPNALYLGRRITKTNEKILTILAREKNIPVFKMRLDDNDPSYELVYYQ